MRFSRHLIAAAALVCGSTALAQLPAQAQIEVPFEGGVLASCEGVGGAAITATAGQLRPSGPDLLSSFPGIAPGSQSAVIDRFSCNSPAQLTLNEVVGVETNGVPLADFDCSVGASSNAVSISGSSPFEPCTALSAFNFGSVPPGQAVTDLEVNLELDYEGPTFLPAGAYEFTVKLDLVP